ncbi:MULTISPECIES: FecR family protein [unclassified Sphingobium]|uniref:FecR family protein n=1 Tax=unclassified Sphingobium TaxID=2611147 RepID=UPI000D1784A1|nr:MULTISPECIES: FecR domain-containing protein [unclassified Sphingobium]MBG6120102.1 transmembrane sensor [Sphingobium sp. JAI105]PSO12852.1 hypothetical protein C7E20_03600 [Sphingobium sp. AEW4]TWD05697.1 FecR family protein [Sphingobium sp. AEW010]TWD23250.1 FecR family protein [Sphingobium sp. AEW013]TWD25110.1 FecR family protein [Sphingobium sp. AEW001]
MRDRLTALADAAAWIARLRNDDRTAEDEAGFRRWLAADPDHRRAFSHLSQTWELAGGVGDMSAPEPAHAPDRRRLLAIAASLASIVAAGGGLAWFYHEDHIDYVSTTGEQRRITLYDGSRLILDSRSHVRVQMRADLRKVELLSGRVNIAVAHDRQRPFVVSAGAREAVALGTAFDVAHEAARVNIFLIEGKLLVRSKESGPLYLAPGDRVRFTTNAPQGIRDRPPADIVTAWQEGQIIFDHTPLQQAAAAFLPYGGPRIEVIGHDLAAQAVSGNFAVEDAAAFARAAATLLDVEVTQQGGTIYLADRKPPLPAI